MKKYACYITGLDGTYKPKFPNYYTDGYDDATAWYKRAGGNKFAFIIDTTTDKAILGDDRRG